MKMGVVLRRPGAADARGERGPAKTDDAVEPAARASVAFDEILRPLALLWHFSLKQLENQGLSPTGSIRLNV